MRSPGGAHRAAEREVLQQMEVLRRENRLLLARLRAFVDTYYPAKVETPPTGKVRAAAGGGALRVSWG